MTLQDMPGLDRLFSTVENYPNMTLQYLTVSTRVPSSPPDPSASLAADCHTPGTPRAPPGPIFLHR